MSAPMLAIVTGGNQGIGREIVRLLAVEGKRCNLHVILTARDAEKGSQAVATLQQEEPSVATAISFHPLDVTSQSSVDALAAHVAQQFNGKLDILVNNAGMAFKGDTFGAVEARATMATNLYGTRRVIEALLPALKRAASPHHAPRIINVCSMAGRLGQVSPELQAAFQTATTPDQVCRLADDFCAAVEDGSYAAKGWPRSMYGVSKLCEIAYTYTLAAAVVHDGVEVQVGRDCVPI